MKVVLNTEYLRKVVIDQVVNNASEWLAFEKTKKWYDNFLFFTDYHFKIFKYECRSDELNIIQKRLDKHSEENIEITGSEFDFIFKGYSK